MSLEITPETSHPVSTSDLLAELAVAFRSKNDQLIILISSQLLGQDDLEPAAHVRTLLSRSHARYRCSHFAGAADDCSRALELDPKNPQALRHRAYSQYHLKEHQSALDDLLAVEAIGVAPDVYELGWRGVCRHGLGDIAGARKEFQAANALDPANITAWTWRADLCQPDSDDLQTALEELDLAMRVLPEESTRHYQRSQLLTRLGRRQDAIAALDRTLELQSDAGLAQFDRAVLKEQLGDFDAALADWADLNTTSPTYGAAYEARIALLRRLGRSQEALTVVDAFAAAVDHWVRPQLLRADILSDMGDRAGRVQALRDAGERAPWDPDIPLLLAGALRDSGDLDAALDVLRERNGHYFSAPIGMEAARILHVLKRLDEALEMADKAILYSRTEPQAYRLRALIRTDLGRLDEAREDHDAALALESAQAEKT